jgi:hypothetical protein
MQLAACVLFLLPLTTYTTQEPGEWQRIYTLEDSTVDVSNSNIVFGSDFTGRIRFRITLSKPEPVSKNATVKYKTVIEAIEFKCAERQYRIFDVKRFDSKGNTVDSDETQRSMEWKDIKPRSMMDKFFTPGCATITEKKRNP